ncbi:MAG: MBL fold metallo-hydrolase [Gemmatimonadetes bacterium]|nr:MBL fold metallo-hydrolase [Gemmatimonadota bacterium]
MSAIELATGVSWIHECYAEPRAHVHVSVFLVTTPSARILMDSGSFYHRDSLASKVSEATDGLGIDALILSHSDYPHSGNIPTFREEWGDFEIVASCADPEIQGLPYARRVRMGETVDVGGRGFTILDPPLADRSHTTWVFEEESRVLFVADGFGTLHPPDSCTATWGEIDSEDRAEGVEDFHAQTLPWLRYADPDRLMGALREIFDHHEPSWVAPIHGPPIEAADLDAYLVDLDAAVRRIADPARADV